MSDRPYTPPLPPEVLHRLYLEAQRRGTKMTRLLKWITENGLTALEAENPPQEKEGLQDVKYRKGVCPTCGTERSYGRKYTLGKMHSQ